MSHLSFDVIYRLAGLVAWDMGFEDRDAENMMHMRKCERCYRQFCATMSMMEALDEFGFAKAETPARQNRDCRKIAAERKAVARVEIAWNVDRFCAELEVISATGGWAFVRPAAAGCGGAMALCPPTRLEDMDNPTASFLEVDPEDQHLQIRLAPGCFGQQPQAWLVSPGGGKTPVTLTGSGKSLQARLPRPAEGKYRIILEK